MFKADVMFKGGRLEYSIDIINIQIIPRRNTSYPYSEEYPSFEDEYNVIYIGCDGITIDVVNALSDITIIKLI